MEDGSQGVRNSSKGSKGSKGSKDNKGSLAWLTLTHGRKGEPAAGSPQRSKAAGRRAKIKMVF